MPKTEEKAERVTASQKAIVKLLSARDKLESKKDAAVAAATARASLKFAEQIAAINAQLSGLGYDEAESE